MKKLTQLNYRNVLGAGASFASRLGALLPNFNLVGSYGFFGSPLLFMVSIVAFDFFIDGFYKGFIFTYLGFSLYPLLGWIARKHLQRQVLLLPVASFLFFVISNLGVFIYWYPHTWHDLVRCYIVALPFYKNTLMGDLFFGYGYLLVKHSIFLRKHLIFSKERRLWLRHI